MENYISIEARSYPITAQHTETGEVLEDYCTISKEQSRASQLVGQSDREFITRMYARNGLKVLTIGKPQKKTLRVDLPIPISIPISISIPIPTRRVIPAPNRNRHTANFKTSF